MIGEAKVDVLLSQMQITAIRGHLQEHLFMKYDLVGIVNSDLVHQVQIIFNGGDSELIVTI